MADPKEDRMATVLASLLGSQPADIISRKRKRENSNSSDETQKRGRSIEKEMSRSKESKDAVNGVHVSSSSTVWTHEKKLRQVAMRGVVQLFNAVNKQQKDLQSQLEAVGSSETKRSKVLSSVDKNQFLEMLKDNNKKPRIKVGEKRSKKRKSEIEQPSWSILRDDTGLESAMERWEEDDNIHD